MDKPKVLVGCPTCNHYEYCTDTYIAAVKNLSYTNYDILLMDNSETDDYFNKYKTKVPMIKTKRIENLKELIARDRNLLRQKAIEGNYDYFLSLEIDVIPPKDVIEKLLSHDKKVVSGVYFKEYGVKIKKAGKLVKSYNTPLPLVWVKHGNPEEDLMRQLNASEVEDHRLIEAKLSGVGCVLIHRDILKKIEFRIDKSRISCDDVWFADDVRKLGFKNYVDTSVKCKHLIKDKKIKFNVTNF
ncbi:MAG: hypothetical protein Q8R00_01230 [Candidatus Nanoarchaeia archaeon]|nr:hypothetical protein [Candidatus Nanoarchaeia archaeon]